MSNSKTVGHSAIARDATSYDFADKINRMLKGELNCVFTTFTLATGTTTTTLTDSRILASTQYVEFMPTTLNAAAARNSGMWCSGFKKGSCTVNHGSSTNTDQTFNVIIVG